MKEESTWWEMLNQILLICQIGGQDVLQYDIQITQYIYVFIYNNILFINKVFNISEAFYMSLC